MVAKGSISHYIRRDVLDKVVNFNHPYGLWAQSGGIFHVLMQELVRPLEITDIFFNAIRNTSTFTIDIFDDWK